MRQRRSLLCLLVALAGCYDDLDVSDKQVLYASVAANQPSGDFGVVVTLYVWAKQDSGIQIATEDGSLAFNGQTVATPSSVGCLRVFKGTSTLTLVVTPTSDAALLSAALIPSPAPAGDAEPCNGAPAYSVVVPVVRVSNNAPVDAAPADARTGDAGGGQ